MKITYILAQHKVRWYIYTLYDSSGITRQQTQGICIEKYS